MIKNRFFKNTPGIFAEIVIAAALDTEETTGTPATPATVSIPITIAADPTPGDDITITVDGVEFKHTIPVGDQTTVQAQASIVALLAANAQGFTVASVTGTTSTVIVLAWAGADKNGKVVSLAETGTSFTAVGFPYYAFADGVDADAAASDTWEDFVANSNAGTIWAFWDGPNAAGKLAALVAGDTKNPANANKKFFYGYKDSAGVAHKTTAIPVKGLKYDALAYAAGQVGIKKVTYGGTIPNGQILHVRITETTATQVPYPSWSYEAVVAGGTVNSAVTALAAAINAETEAPIVSASDTTDTLTVTGLYKNRTFKLSAYIEVSPAQPDDNSAISFPTGGTQNAIAPIGDLETVQELEKHSIINQGGINYAPEGTNVSEFQTSSSNIGSTTQFGIVLVTAPREEAGVVRKHTSLTYVIIAVPTGSQTALAAL